MVYFQFKYFIYICKKKRIKNIKFFLLVAISFSALTASSIENYSIEDARSASLGGASVSLISYSNPAAKSLRSESCIALHYANPYGIKELSTSTANLFYKNRILDFGAAVSQFGYEKYNESRLSATFSKKLSSRLSVGVRLNYLSMMLAAEEGRKSTLSSDIGFLVLALPKLTIGMSAHNFIRTTYSTTRGDFELPITLRSGANYQLMSDLILIAEIEKDATNDPILKIGCEYLPLNEVALRIGMLSNPSRPTFGVGYSPGRLSFDVASVYHTVLGFHTQFSMQYKF